MVLKRASHRSRYRQRRRFIAVNVSVPFNVKRNTLTEAFTPIPKVAQAALLIMVVVVSSRTGSSLLYLTTKKTPNKNNGRKTGYVETCRN